MNLLENAEIKDVLQPFIFELDALSQEVMDMLNTEDKDNSTPDDPGNVMHNDKDA
ncbi:MAG: hypothetical protein WCL18_04680 [bacterium]